MALFTPTNQKRLTNVSVVRLRKGGNRYELACYPNKVRAWRDKLETNLDEVLQTPSVFTNVSKGQFANRKEMFEIFRTDDETQIIKLILEQGELQLTEKERLVEQQALFRDVAKIVSERCVNPENNRAYTVTMIEKMMKDCHVSLKANKSAKQHALEVIKHLRSVGGFNIAAAMMEVVITIDKEVADSVISKLLPLCAEVIRQGVGSEGLFELSAAVEPDKYGTIETLLHSEIKGKYCIEIVGSSRYAGATQSQPKPHKSDAQETKGDSLSSWYANAHEPTVTRIERFFKSDKQDSSALVTSKQQQEDDHDVAHSSTTDKKTKQSKKQKRRNKRNEWPDSD